MRRLFRWLFFLILIGSAAAGAYGYYVLIPKEIETTITRSLQGLGFKTVTFDSVKRNSGKITLRDISLDTKSFSGIESIAVEYSLWNYIFTHQSAESVIVKNLKLTGEINKSLSIAIAGWKNDGKLLSTLTGIPSKSIRIENCTVQLLSPAFGGLTLEYSGELSQNQDHEIAISGTLKTAQKKLEAEARVFGTINRTGSLEIQAQTDDLQVNLVNLSIKRASLYGNMIAFADRAPLLSLELNAGSMIWNKLPLMDTNITLEKKNDIIEIFAEGKGSGSKDTEFSGQIGFMKDIMAFELSIYPQTSLDLIHLLQSSGYIDKNTNFPEKILSIRKPTITIEGKTADRNGNMDGIIRFISPDPEFELSGDYKIFHDTKKIFGSFYMPRTFLDVFKSEKTGSNFLTLSGAGTFSYDFESTEPKIKWDVNSKIEKSNIIIDAIPITAVEGRFSLSSSESNEDEESEKNREIRFTLPLHLNTPHVGIIKLHSNQNKDFIADLLHYSLFGGHIEAKEISLSRDGLPQQFTLEIDDISLSDFSKSLGIPELSIVGKAAGKIPLQKKGNTFHISKGLVQSQQSGILQMPEELSVHFFPGDDEATKKTRNALKNLHYEFFEIRIDGELNGPVMLSFLAKGVNPEDKNMEGTVTVDLKIESNLASIFKNIVN